MQPKAPLKLNEQIYQEACEWFVEFRSGDLDDSIGGPSKDLTPDNHRRTVYGHVSRYKLDAYLQLFDFRFDLVERGAVVAVL